MLNSRHWRALCASQSLLRSEELVAGALSSAEESSRRSVTGSTSQKQDDGKPCSQVLVHEAGGGWRSEWPRSLSGVPAPLPSPHAAPGCVLFLASQHPSPVALNKPIPGDVSQSPEKLPNCSRARSKQHLTLHKACVLVLIGKYDWLSPKSLPASAKPCFPDDRCPLLQGQPLGLSS